MKTKYSKALMWWGEKPLFNWAKSLKTTVDRKPGSMWHIELYTSFWKHVQFLYIVKYEMVGEQIWFLEYICIK